MINVYMNVNKIPPLPPPQEKQCTIMSLNWVAFPPFIQGSLPCLFLCVITVHSDYIKEETTSF